MAVKTFKQLTSSLTVPPTAIATGDTVKNLTTGVLTIVIGVETDVGSAKVILEKEGSEVLVAPGATSAAITLATGEKAYFKDTEASMSSTIDKIVA